MFSVYISHLTSHEKSHSALLHQHPRDHQGLLSQHSHWQFVRNCFRDGCSFLPLCTQEASKHFMPVCSTPPWRQTCWLDAEHYNQDLQPVSLLFLLMENGRLWVYWRHTFTTPPRDMSSSSYHRLSTLCRVLSSNTKQVRLVSIKIALFKGSVLRGFSYCSLTTGE